MIQATLIIYLSINVIFAADWPDCKFQCKAGDVQVVDLWLGDAEGNALSSCDQESKAIAYIWVRIQNNANDPRYALILLADVYLNGELLMSFYDQGVCVSDSIAPKAISAVPLFSFPWSCGEELRIKRLVLSWETSRKVSCDSAHRECHNRNTKCFSDPDIVIQMQPQDCLIQGPNLTCQSSTTNYAPSVVGTYNVDYLVAWYLDGAQAKSVSMDGSLDVNWNHYASGYHQLQLVVSWIDKKGNVLRTGKCQTNVLVVPIPSAVITRN